MDILACLKQRPEAGTREGATTREPSPLWGMLYADHTGVFSEPPEGLKMMTLVIVTVLMAIGSFFIKKGLPNADDTFRHFSRKGSQSGVKAIAQLRIPWRGRQ